MIQKICIKKTPSFIRRFSNDQTDIEEELLDEHSSLDVSAPKVCVSEVHDDNYFAKNKGKIKTKEISAMIDDLKMDLIRRNVSKT